MQDKTIAFVGDSLGRQQFQSLMCMATGGEESPEVEDVGWQYGLVKRRGAIRPDGWAYRFPKTIAISKRYVRFVFRHCSMRLSSIRDRLAAVFEMVLCI